MPSLDATKVLQRDDELATLDVALRSAMDGSGMVALIRGEAGIGKTTLTRIFLERHESDAHVLIGGCDDLLAPRPFQPFWDMAQDLAGLWDALGEGNPDLIHSELRDLLTRSLRPTIVAIEDVHWADQASLDLVKRLGRRIDRSHGLIVLTYRDQETPVEHPLRSVIGDIPAQSTVRLRLKPLTRIAIARMAGEEEADGLLNLTGGNPLLVTEMLRSAEELPSSVVDLVLGRLARLPSKSRQLVELVSIFAGYCPEEVARKVMAFGPAEVIAAEQVELLVAEPERLMFRHELIRRAVERSLSPVTKKELFRRALEVYEERGLDDTAQWTNDFNPALLVELAQGLDDIDRLLRYAPAAAERAVASRSRREALAMFEMVGPHLERLDPKERASILEQWANAVAQTGDIIRARQLREQALQIFKATGADLDAARCMLEISVDFWRSMEEKMAIENAARAVTWLRALDASSKLLADALSAEALIHYLGHNDEVGDQVIAEAIELAPRDSKQLAVAMATSVWGAGTWEEADRMGREALELADQVGSWHAVNIAYNSLTQWDQEVPPRERTSVLEDALAFAEAHQLDDMRAFTLLAYAERHIQAGRFVEAEDIAREAATIWPDREQNLAAWPLGMMARPQMRRGSSQANETLTKLSEFAPVGPPIVDNIYEVLAEAHWLDRSRSFRQEWAMRDLKFFLDHASAWSIDDSSLVYWLWKLGIEVELPVQLHSQYRLQIEGDWEAAAQEWATWERPYERALALSEGPPAAAIEALTILDEIGAVPLASRIRRELRDLGVPGIPTGPRPSTRDNVALLTTRQMEVLELMADGLTNLEIADNLFISLRTAEHHVSAVLSKLDASSRVEAVQIANQLGAVDSN